MFTCADLVRVLNVTTSVKTKLAIVNAIAPRLSDPKVGMEQLVNLFRYAEEKTVVEEAVKTRIQALAGAAFTRGGGMLATGRGGGRGRGTGRGSQRPSLDSSVPIALSSSETATTVVPEEDGKIDTISRKPFSSG